MSLRTDKRQYIVCPFCDRVIRETKIARHVEMQHSLESEELNKLQEMLQEQQKILNKRDSQRQIPCEFCDAELKPKNVDRHMLKVHGVKPDMKLGEMSKSHRRRRLSNLFGPDKEQRKEYLYRNTFVSGGGFGVGKNKKH